ncbi:MAG TPA: hypothetical protein PK511_13245, partial [Chitinophagales bacterium]|nr:hypothetical protein [Chitinophagales bacterium]
GIVGKFTNYSDHPYRGQKGGTAAGAYQILLGTFDLYKKAYPKDIIDFSPTSQDKIVLGIFNRTGALEYIKNGNYKMANDKLTGKPEQFSSLPGGSQSRITNEEFDKMILQNLSNELSGESNIATPKGQIIQSVPNN